MAGRCGFTFVQVAPAACASVLLLAGCAVEGLVGGRYVHAEQPAITMIVEEGFIRGSSGCNMYSAEAVLSDGEAVVGPVMSTMRACADQGQAAAERDFAEVLSQVDSYSVGVDGSLVLSGPGGTVRFLPAG